MKRKYMLLGLLLGAAGIFVLAFAPKASATSITISSVSSDDTPASELSATFDFSVSGKTLTLNVTNNTGTVTDFNINQIYFNSSDGVTT